MKYQIFFSASALRDLNKLPKKERNKISFKIDSLVSNPRPHGVSKLSGENSVYRVRVGDYRIIYQIKDQVLQILVLRVGDRKEVYRHINP